MGLIYNDILEKTGASSATISRVNRSLNYGMGAYRIDLRPHEGRGTEAAEGAAGVSAYESLAACYDELTYDIPLRKNTDHSWRRLLRAVAGSGRDSVLDLACGTGSLSVLLAEHGYRVIGVDLSEEMLAVADEKCSASGGGQPAVFRLSADAAATAAGAGGQR